LSIFVWSFLKGEDILVLLLFLREKNRIENLKGVFLEKSLKELVISNILSRKSLIVAAFNAVAVAQRDALFIFF